MKKLLLFILFFLCTNISFAQAANVEHTSTEAGFSLETLAQWPEMRITKTTVEKNTAFIANFYDNQAKQASFALLVVDGRKNEDFEQTSVDFANNNAHILLSQLVIEEKAQFEKEGYKIVTSEIKNYNGTDYIFMKLENNLTNTIILRSMTFKNGFSYSLNCKINRNNRTLATALEKNFELILQTLKKL